ncbi:hypothetical protein [Sulfurovum sp.]|uniref:hypothetical protein n=1 Tax=Sulfurovum sp. TaxID=1969726 RepID=UPI0025CB7C4F|nr:hypothetical protein [Sulfurovum sp.]
MTATLNSNHNFKGNVHISNYKKALLSMFDNKKIWNYLNEQRVQRQKSREMEKLILSDQVIYH